MKLKSGLGFAMALTIIGLYAFITASSWRWFESKALPMVLAGALVLLGLARVIVELRTHGKAKLVVRDAGEEEVPVDSIASSRLQWQRFGVIMAWLAGFVVAIYLLGFIAAIFVFITMYVKNHGGTWLRSVIFGGSITGVSYAIFILGLQVQLYKGLIPGMLG